MSGRVLYHLDASDTIIYVSQKATPVRIPCVRPQSDMRCYWLDRCDLESGSWHFTKGIVKHKHFTGKQLMKAQIKVRIDKMIGKRFRNKIHSKTIWAFYLAPHKMF